MSLWRLERLLERWKWTSGFLLIHSFLARATGGQAACFRVWMACLQFTIQTLMQEHCTRRPDSVWVCRTQFAIYLRQWVPTAILKRRTIWILMSFPSFPATTRKYHAPFPGLVTVAVPALFCLAQRTSMNRAGSRRPWPVGRSGCWKRY